MLTTPPVVTRGFALRLVLQVVDSASALALPSRGCRRGVLVVRVAFRVVVTSVVVVLLLVVPSVVVVVLVVVPSVVLVVLVVVPYLVVLVLWLQELLVLLASGSLPPGRGICLQVVVGPVVGQLSILLLGKLLVVLVVLHRRNVLVHYSYCFGHVLLGVHRLDCL